MKQDLENIVKISAPTYGLSFKKLDKRYRTCDLDKINKKIKSFRKQREDEIGKELPCFSGAFTLNTDFLSYNPVYYEDGEAGIPHTLFNYNKNVNYYILKEWIQINKIEDLKLTEELFLSKSDSFSLVDIIYLVC